METKPKITIGIPVGESSIPIDFFVSFMQLQKPRAKFIIEKGAYVDHNRNQIVEQAEGEYLFFIDYDTILPEDALVKLLKHDLPIVCGLYFTKHLPYTPLLFKYVKEKDEYLPMLDYPEGLIEVDGTGLGCALIKLEVFRKLEKPYFQQIAGKSEDLYFYRKVREKGFKVFVDTTIKCGHVTQVTVIEENFKKLRPTIQYGNGLKHLIKQL